MTTLAMRVDDEDAELIRRSAAFAGKSISEFVREAVFEKIEDEADLRELRRAMARATRTSRCSARSDLVKRPPNGLRLSAVTDLLDAPCPARPPLTWSARRCSWCVGSRQEQCLTPML